MFSQPTSIKVLEYDSYEEGIHERCLSIFDKKKSLVVK